MRCAVENCREDRPAITLERGCSTLLIFLLAIPSLAVAAESESTDNVLRPPRGEIQPTFWERNGAWIALLTLAVIVLLALIVWFLRQKKPPAPPSHALVAHEALKPFANGPEDGAAISQISRIVRQYFTDAFRLPHEELTTPEFARACGASEPMGADLAKRAGEFLTECDQRKFAPENRPGQPWALPKAVALIELSEQRRAYLRQQQILQESANDARQS